MNINKYPVANSLQAADEEIACLLDIWKTSIGPPTCRNGCSNCCRGEIVASTAEVRLLLDFIAAQPAAFVNEFRSRTDAFLKNLRKAFQGATTGQFGMLATTQRIDLIGTCPYLKNRSCSIYDARPYACRAMHSWGDSNNCGRGLDNAGTPLELYQIRSQVFSEAMKQEAREGRYPFYGLLPVIVHYLTLHRDQYEDGTEFSSIIDPFWEENKLLWFPYNPRQENLQQVILNIDQQQQQQKKAYSFAKALARLPST